MQMHHHLRYTSGPQTHNNSKQDDESENHFEENPCRSQFDVATKNGKKIIFKIKILIHQKEV